MKIYKTSTDGHQDTASGLDYLPHYESSDDIAFSSHDAWMETIGPLRGYEFKQVNTFTKHTRER